MDFTPISFAYWRFESSEKAKGTISISPDLYRLVIGCRRVDIVPGYFSSIVS